MQAEGRIQLKQLRGKAVYVEYVLPFTSREPEEGGEVVRLGGYLEDIAQGVVSLSSAGWVKAPDIADDDDSKIDLDNMDWIAIPLGRVHFIAEATCSELRISGALLENIRRFQLTLRENIALALLTLCENRLPLTENCLKTSVPAHIK